MDGWMDGSTGVIALWKGLRGGLLREGVLKGSALMFMYMYI
jgi:hypothetical protein